MGNSNVGVAGVKEGQVHRMDLLEEYKDDLYKEYKDDLYKEYKDDLYKEYKDDLYIEQDSLVVFKLSKDKDGIKSLLLETQIYPLGVLELLIDKGADVNYACKRRSTALIWASRNGRLDVVMFLIDKGADINHRDHVCQEMMCVWGCSEVFVAMFL
eukprot:GHVR01150168.1.p1 GENE.GHVR01150168.1~~GHVR01150168.1.p1  ORF type:complete len:156 (+),score=22.89 GHVR01150168.1:71-538(+)